MISIDCLSDLPVEVDVDMMDWDAGFEGCYGYQGTSGKNVMNVEMKISERTKCKYHDCYDINLRGVPR